MDTIENVGLSTKRHWGEREGEREREREGEGEREREGERVGSHERW